MKVTIYCCIVVCLAYATLCVARPGNSNSTKSNEVKETPVKSGKGKAGEGKAGKGKHLGKCTTDAQCPSGYACLQTSSCKSKSIHSARKCYPSPDICESSPCLNNGTCIDHKNGTFTCICESGYAGTNCSNIDECILNTDNCHVNAECQNTEGSFQCFCNAGYSGDGVSCTEVQICEFGWFFHNGSCYFFSEDVKNWNDAREDCINRGGYLVEISSIGENEFVYDNVDYGVWIGLTDSVTEHQYVWTGSGTVASFTLFNSVYGNYNTDHKDCVLIQPMWSYYWKFNYCSQYVFYICEKDAY